MTFRCQAILFDLDGTLIDSIAAVDRAWTRWAVRHGLDPAVIVPQIHGRRAIDSMRLLAPHLDVEVEDIWLRSIEATDTEGIVPIAGALEFVASIPRHRWAVVTSGASPVGLARLKAGGLVPDVAVFAEDVSNGKPSPDPYLLAAQRLDCDPGRCLVFEDAVAGVRSGKAAGMRVIAISRDVNRTDLSEADSIVPNYLSLRVGLAGDDLEVVFDSER